MNCFLLKDEATRQRAVNFINAMNLTGDMEVVIKKRRKDRTTAQNRLMWMWYGLISKDTGYTAEEVHELFKSRILGVEEKQIMGEPVLVVKSTTKLTTQEFTDYLNAVEQAAHLIGITLPHPEDLYEYAVFGSRRPPSFGASTNHTEVK